MTNYRIYYAEREVRNADRLSGYLRGGTSVMDIDAISETDWEEEVEAGNTGDALDSFFREHVRDRSEIMRVDDEGRSYPVEGIAALDPGMTYIWIEDGKLMEFQGMDEATPGMVTCPLCDGEGEVDEELAEQFVSEYGEEGEE